MADMANEIKLLSGNSHPSLAKAVADRYVPLFFLILLFPRTSDALYTMLRTLVVSYWRYYDTDDWASLFSFFCSTMQRVEISRKDDPNYRLLLLGAKIMQMQMQ